MEVVSHGYMAGSQIDEEARDEERMDFAVVLLWSSSVRKKIWWKGGRCTYLLGIRHRRIVKLFQVADT